MASAARDKRSLPKSALATASVIAARLFALASLALACAMASLNR
jgi:hypothetical protein